MLLSLTTTHQPATDLGYLLHKHPEKVQSFALSFGTAQVFYPEATTERCTAALLVEVDPVGLVRKQHGRSGLMDQYVNDRLYAASSFLSVAIAQVFDSALNGRCKTRPELVELPLALKAVIPVLPCRGGESLLRRLFEPLGYHVTARRLALDARFPDWGESIYYSVELEASLPLHQMLGHLYVLVPVLDDEKHYWVGDDEIEKLMRHSEGWLATHPERDSITRRYLKHQRSLVSDALEQLMAESEPSSENAAAVEDTMERSLSLHEQRLGAVLAALKGSGAASVLDLGCGEGKLLRLLMEERQFTRIVGMDVSHRSLQIAADRLHYDSMPEVQKARLSLLHGSLMYRDSRLEGFDAAAVVEVIEHLDAPRLEAFERVLFECARPAFAIVTTPNREYNVKWESLLAGEFRHRDHRFEWTRAEFQEWAARMSARFGYEVRFLPMGPVDEMLGAPTQAALFERRPA